MEFYQSFEKDWKVILEVIRKCLVYFHFHIIISCDMLFYFPLDFTDQ